jgi:hypothetical protein
MQMTESTFYSTCSYTGSTFIPEVRVNILLNMFVYRVNILPKGQSQHFTQHVRIQGQHFSQRPESHFAQRAGIQGEHFAQRSESTFYSVCSYTGSTFCPEVRVDILLNMLVYRVNILPKCQSQHFTQHVRIQGQHFAQSSESTFYSACSYTVQGQHFAQRSESTFYSLDLSERLTTGHSEFTRSRIHEHTISLRFMDII